MIGSPQGAPPDGKYYYGCLAFVVDAYQLGANLNLRPWVDVPIHSDTYPSDIWGHFTHDET
jgi:hypothetical protein